MELAILRRKQSRWRQQTNSTANKHCTQHDKCTTEWPNKKYAHKFLS